MAEAVRATMRTMLLPPLAAGCLGDFIFSGARGSLRDRVDWLRRSSLRHAKWIGVKIRAHGEVPRAGLIHDVWRPVLTMNYSYPATTPAGEHVADVCIPVLPDRRIEPRVIH